MITITTKPISVNRLYQGRRFLTKEAKVTKATMAFEVGRQWKGGILEGPISLAIRFYFKDKRGLDIDGALKGLLDCMTGLVWKDDRQIVELNVAKLIDKDRPRVELEIINQNLLKTNPQAK